MLETFFFARDNRHACTVTDLDDGPLYARKQRAIAKAIQRIGVPAQDLLAAGPFPITRFITAAVHERTMAGTGLIQRPSIFTPLYGDDLDAAITVRSELPRLWIYPLESRIYIYAPTPHCRRRDARRREWRHGSPGGWAGTRA